MVGKTIHIGWVMCVSLWALQAGAQKPGFIDINGYHDTRNTFTGTINLLGTMPAGFQYFSLTNVLNQDVGVQRSDLTVLYSEQNLRWTPVKPSLPFDASWQAVIRSGAQNDVHRFGIRWRLHSTSALKKRLKAWKLKFAVTAHLIQLSPFAKPLYPAQLEYVYRLNLVGDRIYLAGFADQNFQRISSGLVVRWVTEHQIGFRVLDQLHLIAELRYNQYLQRSLGLGYGLQYIFK